MPEIKFKDGEDFPVLCPEHRLGMIVRTNKKNGRQFLGCPEWPECAEIAQIPEEYYARAMGQPPLFSLE